MPLQPLLSVQLSSTEYIHMAVQPSPPSSPEPHQHIIGFEAVCELIRVELTSNSTSWIRKDLTSGGLKMRITSTWANRVLVRIKCDDTV